MVTGTEIQDPGLAGRLSGPPLKVHASYPLECVNRGLAGRLSGPPLKALTFVGRCQRTTVSGRTIVRPSIEGTSPNI